MTTYSTHYFIYWLFTIRKEQNRQMQEVRTYLDTTP
jgi:hypothetical protein